MARENEPAEPITEDSYGLARRLGLFTAIMVIMGNIIGSGVFKKAAPMAEAVQSAGLLLACWVFAGTISLMGALTNAEVAGIISGSGGYYDYFKKMYGRPFAFVFGWSSFAVMQSASIASIAYVFGESANALLHFPRLSESWEQLSVFGIFFPFQNFGVKAFTILTLLSLTAVNYCGVIFGGLVGNITTVLKLAGIGAIIVFGLAAGNGSWTNLAPLGPAPDAHYTSQLGLFGAMFSAMLGAFWAYDGWNNITCMGGELRNPKRNIPLSLGIGVAGVMTVYLLVNFAYLYVMPVAQLRAVAATPNAIAGVEVMRSAWGDTAAKMVAVLILLSTFGCVNCQILLTSRTFFTMARDGLFVPAAARCHPKYRTPSNALLMEGIWASVLVLSGSFDQLSDMVIFASFIFYGAAAFGVFVLRKKMPDAPRPYRVTGYPFTPAIFVIFCAILVAVTVVQRPREAGIGLALIALGLPFYAYWNRKARS